MREKIFFSLLLVISLTTFSFGAETIYTWGYGDVLANILESVSTLMQTDDYKALFKIFLVIGLVLVLLSYFGDKKQDPFALIRFYVITIGIWYTLIEVHKTDVYIDDKQNPSYSRVVNNVPTVLAKVLSWFSKLEKISADKIELVFGVPENLRYANSGMLSAFNVMSNANSHKIVDPYLYLSTSRYIEDCVFPEILDGTKDINLLARSNDLWTDLQTTNGFRTTKYYNSTNPNGIIKTCRDAYSLITADLNNYSSITGKGFKALKGIVGAVSESQLNTILGTASEHYLNFSVTGQAYLKQATAMNMFSEAFQNFAKVNGISGEGLALGLGKAEETARYNMVLSGALGAKYIPIIKGVLTVLVVALIPVLTLFLVTPMFKKVLLGFFMILGWLSLWHVGDVLLNALIDIRASSFLTTLADGNYNLLIKGAVDSKILDYINTVSSFYWAIPTIAFLIVSGFSIYAMAQMSGQVSGKMQGSTGSTSGELATGSINTSSNTSTGTRFNFNSFSSLGNSMQLAYAGSGVFGIDTTVNQRFSGVGESKSINFNANSLTDINSTLGMLAKNAGLDLTGSERYVGSYMQQGNIMKFNGGNFGGRYSVSGSYNTQTKSGHFTFMDSVTGRKYDMDLANGQISQLKVSGGGSNIDIRTGKDGNKYFSLETANGISVSGLIDKDGNTHIQKANLPDKLQGTDVWKQLNEELTGLSNILNSSSSIADAFRKGNTEQKLEMLDYMFKVASGENLRGSRDYKLMQNTSAKALQETLRQMGEGADNIVEKAHKIDKERALKYIAAGNGYIKVEGGGKLPFDILSAKAGLNVKAGFENQWISKDGLILKDKDGNYWKIDFTEKGQEIFAKNFDRALSTSLNKSGSFETGKSSDYRENEQSGKFSESFKNLVAQAVNQDSSKLEQIKRYANEQGINLNQDLTRFLVESIAERDHRPLEDVVNELVNNPNKIRDYLENDDIRNDVLNRAYGEYKLDKEITFNNAEKAIHSNAYYDIANEIIGNSGKMTDDYVNKVKEQIEEAHKSGALSDEEYSRLMSLIDEQKLKFDGIPNVKAKDYNEKDALNKAKDKGIDTSNVYKNFDRKLENAVNNTINKFKNSVGFDNKLKGIQEGLIKKYGSNIQEGIEIAWSKLNSQIRELVNNEDVMNKLGIERSTIKKEDIQNGKALALMEQKALEKINEVDNQIKETKANIEGINNLLNNPHIVNNPYVNIDREGMLKTLETEKQKLEELYKQKDEYTAIKEQIEGLMDKRQEIINDQSAYRNLNLAMEKTEEAKLGTHIKDNGLLMANPQREVNYPKDLNFTISPQYKYPWRPSGYDDTVKFWGGNVGISTERFMKMLDGKNLQQIVRENLANNPEVTKIRNKYLQMFNHHSPIAQRVHDFLYYGKRY